MYLLVNYSFRVVIYLAEIVKYSTRGWRAHTKGSFSGNKYSLIILLIIPMLMFIGNIFRVIGAVYHAGLQHNVYHIYIYNGTIENITDNSIYNYSQNCFNMSSESLQVVQFFISISEELS